MWYKDGKTFNSVQAIKIDLGAGVILPAIPNDSTLTDLGYLKVVDNGQPTITEVQTVQDGGVVLEAGVPTKVWNVVDMFADTPEVLDADGVTVITPAKTKAEYEAEYLAIKQAEVVAGMVQHFTDVTTQYIEAKVQEYNKANNVAFKDIDAFTKYAINVASPYNAIANQFIAYADAVWLAVRTYQATATTIPTEEEFKAVLDAVVF